MTAIAIINSIQTIHSKNWPVFKALTVGLVSDAVRWVWLYGLFSSSHHSSGRNSHTVTSSDDTTCFACSYENTKPNHKANQK